MYYKHTAYKKYINFSIWDLCSNALHPVGFLQKRVVTAETHMIQAILVAQELDTKVVFQVVKG